MADPEKLLPMKKRISSRVETESEEIANEEAVIKEMEAEETANADLILEMKEGVSEKIVKEVAILETKEAESEEIENVEIKVSEQIENAEIKEGEEIENVEIKVSEEIENVEIKVSEQIESAESEQIKEIEQIEIEIAVPETEIAAQIEHQPVQLSNQKAEKKAWNLFLKVPAKILFQRLNPTGISPANLKDNAGTFLYLNNEGESSVEEEVDVEDDLDASVWEWKRCLPIGYEFNPSPVQVIKYYLIPRLLGSKEISYMIREEDAYLLHPRKLKIEQGGSWFYCHSLRQFIDITNTGLEGTKKRMKVQARAIPNDTRRHAKDNSGNWIRKSYIFYKDVDGSDLGSKTSFTFHEESENFTFATDWSLEEFRYLEHEHVICKVWSTRANVVGH